MKYLGFAEGPDGERLNDRHRSAIVRTEPWDARPSWLAPQYERSLFKLELYILSLCTAEVPLSLIVTACYSVTRAFCHTQHEYLNVTRAKIRNISCLADRAGTVQSTKSKIRSAPLGRKTCSNNTRFLTRQGVRKS